MSSYNPTGKRFELWQHEYVKHAYEDQMGIKREANVIRRKVIVTVVKTLPLNSNYRDGEVFEHGIWIATDETGAEYRQHFDELSMGGRTSWWDGKSAWIEATPRGWFTPYMNPDGTKAVPQELN
jgi:hypothetical protein